MTDFWWFDPLLTAVIVWAMLWALEPAAYRLGLLDHPGGRKEHAHPTPVIGGLAMAIGILVPVAWEGAYPRAYLGFMLGSLLLIGVGLLDDARDVRWWIRVLIQVAAALVMIYVGGVRVEYLGDLLGSGPVQLGAWSVPFTVLATVGVINAFNMSDGVDGLAGSLAVVAMLMYCAAALYSGNTFMVERLTPVIAAVSVFLLFNMRSPWRARARVFMGNAGSAFLGYLIAWVCFRLTQNPGHPVTPVLAPFFVAPLIIDCLVLIVRRLREGRSPFAASRDHMHHFMLDAGLTPTQIAVTLSLASAALGLGAALALRSNRVPDGMLLLAFLVLTAGYYWLSADRARVVATFALLQRALAFTRRRPDRYGTAGERRHEDESMDEQQQDRIAVIGLGYVGLPLAVEFARKYDTVGFDIASGRIEELRAGRDSTLEVEPERLAGCPRLSFSASVEDIAGCNVYIVTVPTPIDAAKRPDLGPLVRASQSVGGVLKRGDLVVYESTVYPGCTEEVCVPLLEKHSGLQFNRDFFVGYSPERINPGDKEHRLTTIRKVTSGSTPEAAARVDALYASIIDAGTHRASSIRVAEAAKVIENTQRDLNIALVNELAVLFGKLGIDTVEVLEAAGTKWNFLPFRPGLVGGHCISVDPYYLTHKAQEIGHHADVILAGRRINDSMGEHVASEVIRLMARHRLNPVGARILVLGLAFKENCPDLRNTRVIDIVTVLRQYHAEVDVFDPWVDSSEAEHEYGLRPIAAPEAGRYDAAIVAVAHRQFLALGTEGIRALLRPGGVLYDVKAALPRAGVDGRL